MKLTMKQEAFCRKYLLTGNASEAYRQSYAAENMKIESVHRKASELLENGMVTARIEVLQRESQERFEITRDRQIKRYVQLLELAEEKIKDPKSHIEAATRILARLDKICGLEKLVLNDKPPLIINISGKEAL